MHTDAAQSAGKIPVDVEALGVDLLSLAGHKLYAPKGVGALYVRRGVRLEKLVDGAGQESGRRPGTENVLEIAGLRARVSDMRVNGHPERRLPNTLSASFRGLDAQTLLRAMESRVAASAGAACHSGAVEISHVLEAMHVPLEWARGTLRFSTGRMNTHKDVEEAVDAVACAIADY